MSTKRRYKIGTEPTYDHWYDRAMKGSVLFNDTGSIKYGFAQDQNSPAKVKSLLAQWEGDGRNPDRPDHYYVPGRDGGYKPSILANYKQKLEDLKAQWNIRNAEREKKGQELLAAEPKDIKAKRVYYEAIYDVACAEAAYLKKRLKELEESKREEKKRYMFRGGLRQSSLQRKGVLESIDGQTVGTAPTDKRVLIIDDPDSPYDGMAVKDYRRMADIWLDDFQQKRQSEREREEREGIPQPQSQARGPVRNDELPAWPDGVKNYKEDTKVKA